MRVFRSSQAVVANLLLLNWQADYVGKSVLIFGKGNAGMETAANLLDVANYVHVTSRSPVRLALATHYVGDVRLTGRAGSVLEGYQLKSMNGFFDTKWDQLIDYVEFRQVEDGDGVTRIRLAPLASGGLSNLSAIGEFFLTSPTYLDEM